MAVLVGLFEISVDRYLTVVKKERYKVTRRQFRIFLCSIWIMSGAYGIPWSNVFRGTIYRNYIALIFVNYFSELTATDKAFQGVTFTVFLLAFCFIAFTSYRILHTSAADQASFEQIKITSRRSIKSEFTMIITNCILFLVFNTINCSFLQMRKELLSSSRGWKVVFDSFFED